MQLQTIFAVALKYLQQQNIKQTLSSFSLYNASLAGALKFVIGKVLLTKLIILSVYIAINLATCALFLLCQRVHPNLTTEL